MTAAGPAAVKVLQGMVMLTVVWRLAPDQRRTLPVTIPPGVRDRSSFAYKLDSIGMPEVTLHIDVRIR